jgi:hypothetical protein
MHLPVNVKSPNNISKWQMGFNSAFKELIFELLCDLIHCRNENYTTGKTVKETNAESETVTAVDVYI